MNKSIKTTLLFALLLTCFYNSKSQVISTNRNPVGLEHNLLFNATKRYAITQNGTGQVNLNSLFDGKFEPSYSNSGISSSDPTVITIENLPEIHTQVGAWVGWTTRLWPAKRFKIEGYETYYNKTWITLADYSNSDFDKFDFYTAIKGIYTKFRFTFYEGTGDGGKFGLSEIFFIHPEATTPYEGLLNAFRSITEVNNNILIGKASQNNPNYKLDVAGKVRADEITVNTSGADFVFEKEYNLRPLHEVEAFIKENRHLPDVAPAKTMQENGVSVGEMNTKLLQKVEELTLYLIEKDKEIKEMKKEINHLKQNKKR